MIVPGAAGVTWMAAATSTTATGRSKDSRNEVATDAESPAICIAWIRPIVAGRVTNVALATAAIGRPDTARAPGSTVTTS